MESSCEKMSENREISSPETVKTSSITATTTSTVKDESERCSQSSLSSETNQLTKKRRTSSPINDQEKNNDNQQLSKHHSKDENFEETNTCKTRGASNCDDNKKYIYVDELASETHQNNEITTCDLVESNDELISLKVDSTLCETESSVDRTDPIKAESSGVTSYGTKLSSMATSPVQMMLKDSNKEESGQVSSPTSEAVNPCQTITTELRKSPTSVIVKAKTSTATATSTSSTTAKSSLLSSESSLETVTTSSTTMTTVHWYAKQEDENEIDKNVNSVVIKEEMRSNQMDECDDDNINDLKKQEICSSDSTNSTAINDTKCNSVIVLSSSSESSNGDSVNIQRSVQSSPLLDDLSKTVQKNTETSNFSTSYISKNNDKNTKNHENSNDDGDDQIDQEAIPIEIKTAIPTSTIMAITKAETTKTTLSATVEPAVEGISFGLDNILSKAKTQQSNLCTENSVSSLNPSPSKSSQLSTSTKNDINTMSTSPKDLDPSSLQKSGRWNTMHVRISWEILRQQKASQGDKSNSSNSSSPLPITPSSTSFNLKSPTILPPSSSSASSISLPTLSKNSHLPYDLIRPPTTNIFGNLTPGLQIPQSQSHQQQNQFLPQRQPHTHPLSQPPPLHHYHQQNQSQPSTPHSRSLEISSFSASLMNAASGGLNTKLPLDSNPWDHRSPYGPVSLASGHLPYPSLQAPSSSSSLSYTTGSSLPSSLALSSSSSTSSVSTPSITAPISSLGKINGNNDILRSSNSIYGLPPRPGEMASFSTSLYNAAVAAAGHGLNRPNLEAWNSPFAPGPGMSSIAAHNFIRSSLPGFPGFPHPHPHSQPHPHSPHNNLGLPGSVPTSMSNNLFANLAPPPKTPHSSASSISSSNMDSLMNTPGRPGSSIFPPIGREEHLPPISSSSGCGTVPGSGSSSSSSTSTSWGGLKAEAEKSESGKHKDGTSRNISSRSKDEIRSDAHHHHHRSSNNNSSNSNSSSSNNKIVGSKHSSLLSSSNPNGDYESSHRRDRDKSSNSQKREHSRPSSVSSISSGNKMMKTSSSAFNDNRSSHINESKAKDDRKDSINNYNKYLERSNKHSSNSTDRQAASSSGVSNLPADFLNAERDWEYRCQLAGLTEPIIPGMMPYPVSLTRDYQNTLWDPLSQPFPSHFLEQERIFQRYNILNSSGGGAPLTEKLTKEVRGKEMAAFPPVFDRCAQYPLTNLIPNPPSLASPFGGPSSLVHGPGNLGIGHALPPPPPALSSLPQSQPHPHPSSTYHHQLHQQHHHHQTSPGQSTPSSSSVIMFPPNPYLNSLHSLSASAGSNVRTDLNNRTKSLSS